MYKNSDEIVARVCAKSASCLKIYSDTYYIQKLQLHQFECCNCELILRIA